MQTTCFTGRKEQTGRSRNIGFAGKSIQLQHNTPMWTTSANLFSFVRDAFTTSSDFIISPHPAAKGLYVATCGSFHGWKFFPVLGKYILQMVDGSLPPAFAEKWAWDRERPDPKHNADWPRAEMKDLLDSSSKL